MKTKFIFLTLGTKGDLCPFLGLAIELKKRGYPAPLILSSEDHREFCESEGMEFEAVQTREEHERIFNHPDIWKPLEGLKIYLRETVVGTAEKAFHAIENQVKKQPCVLICNNIMIGGLLAREKLKIPTASVFLHPFSHFSLIDPPKDTSFKNILFKLVGKPGRAFLLQQRLKVLNACLLPFNDLRKKEGLKPLTDIIARWRYSVPLMLDLWPEWYCPMKPDWPKQTVRTGFVNYDGPQGKEGEWIDRFEIRAFMNESPLLFTMGSGMVQDYEAQVALFSGACKILNRKGLMISASIKGKGVVTINENFKVIESAPFHEVFLMGAAIITHGGIGTVARALASNKPILVAPLAFDQFDNGYHVQRLRAGLCIPFRSLTPRKLARALDRLVSPASGVFVKRPKDTVDGIQTTCDLIENKLVKENR